MVASNEIRLFQVEPSQIDPDPRQPRKSFDEKELLDLANSMLKDGQKYPIRVHRLDELRYQVIGGERRWRAALLKKLPLVFIQVEAAPLSEAELIIDQIVDNQSSQRLNIIEMASACQRLMELGLSNKEIAERIHVTEGSVSRYLTVGGCLSKELHPHVYSGKLPAHEAYIIAKVKNKANQVLLAEQFMRGDLNRAELEARSREESGKATTKRDNTLTLVIKIPREEGYAGLDRVLQQKKETVKRCQANKVPFDLVAKMWEAE